jgi:hypothetical protein
VQAQVEHVLDAARIQHRQAGGHEQGFGLVGQRRGFAQVVVADHGEHAAVGRGARVVGVLDGVHGAVEAGALAVPEPEHAVVARAGKQADLLRPPDRSRGQLLVDAGLEADVVALEMAIGLP